MIIGIILHVLFGAFLATMLWFFGLGGMTAWFQGKPSGWLDSSRGGLFIVLIGALLGYISYVYRDRDIIARTHENAERFRFARLALKFGVPLFTFYLLWLLKK
jgi:hypothetical protein